MRHFTQDAVVLHSCASPGNSMALTLCAVSRSANSRNAKRMALFASPQIRQSTTHPHSEKNVASCSSVTCLEEGLMRLCQHQGGFKVSSTGAVGAATDTQC